VELFWIIGFKSSKRTEPGLVVPPLINRIPTRHKILVVDDEPDIFTLTKLSLKGLKYKGRQVDLLSTSTGQDAVRTMRTNPDIALILLDVVMETNSAGLDASRRIRDELGNSLVRILLRTGQPGEAPERQSIEQYDIDGYLPKVELTSDRLYAAVRTALKAWEELVDLDRHRSYLKSVHECIVSLRSFEPLENALQHILATAVEVCPTDFGVLGLETFDKAGNPRSYLLHLAPGIDDILAGTQAAAITAAVRRSEVVDGHVERFQVHRELGYGFIYLRMASPDELALTMLPLLTAHAANELYSTIFHAMLSAPGIPSYDVMPV
jgi:CheY-like chemotaxis protein